MTEEEQQALVNETVLNFPLFLAKYSETMIDDFVPIEKYFISATVRTPDDGGAEKYYGSIFSQVESPEEDAPAFKLEAMYHIAYGNPEIAKKIVALKFPTIAVLGEDRDSFIYPYAEGFFRKKRIIDAAKKRRKRKGWLGPGMNEKIPHGRKLPHPSTRCANEDCKHLASDHDRLEGPCRWKQTPDAVFNVCECVKFEVYTGELNGNG